MRLLFKESTLFISFTLFIFHLYTAFIKRYCKTLNSESHCFDNLIIVILCDDTDQKTQAILYKVTDSELKIIKL